MSIHLNANYDINLYILQRMGALLDGTALAWIAAVASLTQTDASVLSLKMRSNRCMPMIYIGCDIHLIMSLAPSPKE